MLASYCRVRVHIANKWRIDIVLIYRSPGLVWWGLTVKHPRIIWLSTACGLMRRAVSSMKLSCDSITCWWAHWSVPAVPSDLYPTIPHIDTNARDSTVSFLDRQEVMLISNVEKFPVWDYPLYKCEGREGRIHNSCTVLIEWQQWVLDGWLTRLRRF